MGFKENNPIQQRMELLSEKWEKTIQQPEAHLIRIHAQENESQMVNTFYTYLLGIDTRNKDIVIIFESAFEDNEQYSLSLLQELEELIETWNKANKDNLAIQTQHIEWKPDHSLKNNKPAYLFTENMNRFAAYLDLADNIYLVAALLPSSGYTPGFNDWIEGAIKAGIQQSCKLTVNDTASDPLFAPLAEKYPVEIATLAPQLDMDNAMQQLAAMGNPNDPAVPYRRAFIKLTQAIEKRNEQEAEKHAGTCIEIALKNLRSNPYWIGQIIVVYAALANDQVGYKNYKKALGYATLGVEAAQKSKEVIADEFVQRKFVAQAAMLRGSLYAVSKAWEKAIADFETAAANYGQTNDHMLAMEAWRMTADSCMNYGDRNLAGKALAEVLTLSKSIPVHILKYTTFAGALELLLKLKDNPYCSYKDAVHYGEIVYGKAWLKEVSNWKNLAVQQVPAPAGTEA